MDKGNILKYLIRGGIVLTIIFLLVLVFRPPEEEPIPVPKEINYQEPEPPKPNITNKSEPEKNITNKSAEKEKVTQVSNLSSFKGSTGPKTPINKTNVKLKNSEIIREDSDCLNSHYIGYSIEVTQGLDELEVDCKCTDEKNNQFSFVNLKENIRHNIYGEHPVNFEGTWADLSTEKDELELPVIINSPVKTRPEAEDNKIVFNSLKEGEYQAVYDFSVLAEEKKDKNFKCTTKIHINDKWITKNFELNYVYDT
ncbi:MAG: hypothetical protein ACOCQG_04135 [Candidatus Nanoarchaeia archaeon]